MLPFPVAFSKNQIEQLKKIEFLNFHSVRGRYDFGTLYLNSQDPYLSHIKEFIKSLPRICG